MIVTLNNLFLDLPAIYKEGHTLTKAEANALNTIWLAKLLSQLRTWINKNPSVSVGQAHEHAKYLADTIVIDANGKEDPITLEAIEISKEQIIAKLAAEGLPAPNNLDIHAIELAQSPTIIAAARQRVEARFKAGIEILKLEGALS